MRILGIDPGILHLGYALLDLSSGKLDLMKFGSFNPPRGLPYAKKLSYLYERLEGLISATNPDHLAVEEYLPQVNPGSSAKLAQAQALVLLLSDKFGIPVKLYHPSTWQSMLTGSSQVSAEDLVGNLRRIFRLDPPSPQNEHALSALGLALSLALELKVF